MNTQQIADITFRAWRLAMERQDHQKAAIYETHLLTLGYVPLSIMDGYLLLQDRTPLPYRLPERWHKAAHRLRSFDQQQFLELARVVDDVATCLYANGRVITFAWIDRQLPYYQEFFPIVARSLTHIKAHLLRKPRENGD